MPTCCSGGPQRQALLWVSCIPCWEGVIGPCPGVGSEIKGPVQCLTFESLVSFVIINAFSGLQRAKGENTVCVSNGPGHMALVSPDYGPQAPKTHVFRLRRQGVWKAESRHWRRRGKRQGRWWKRELDSRAPLPFAGESLGPQESTNPLEAEEINPAPLERAFQIWPQAICDLNQPQSTGPQWAYWKIQTPLFSGGELERGSLTDTQSLRRGRTLVLAGS